jgi:hypothetical protein
VPPVAGLRWGALAQSLAQRPVAKGVVDSLLKTRVDNFAVSALFRAGTECRADPVHQNCRQKPQ